MLYTNYVTYEVLNREQLNTIHQVLNESNSETEWRDGLHTTEHHNSDIKKNLEYHNSDIKKNLEYYPENRESYRYIVDIINFSMDKSFEFLELAVPYTNTSPIISKTNVDGYYNLHVDKPENGDFSTTIFLSDKDSYEGGELSIFVDNEERKIKLDAGYAVTYNTGLPHFVNKVTSGERLAAIFWSHSLFRDIVHRQIYSEISALSRLVNNKESKIINSFDIYKEDYTMRLTLLKNFLMKNYSRKIK